MTQQNKTLNIIIGISALVVAHVAFFVLCFFLVYLLERLGIAEPFDIYNNSANLGLWVLLALFGIGLTQIIYALPLWLWLVKKGRSDTAKGVLIGAAITALLNGTCFILLGNI